jgi:hypothetical protein
MWRMMNFERPQEPTDSKEMQMAQLIWPGKIQTDWIAASEF